MTAWVGHVTSRLGLNEMQPTEHAAVLCMICSAQAMMSRAVRALVVAYTLPHCLGVTQHEGWMRCHILSALKLYIPQNSGAVRLHLLAKPTIYIQIVCSR